MHDQFTRGTPAPQPPERSQRLVAAYMQGAESGMVECRGYGLTATERDEAEREAISLYAEPIPASA